MPIGNSLLLPSIRDDYRRSAQSPQSKDAIIEFPLTHSPPGNREVLGLNADTPPMSAVVQKPKKKAPRANELANRFAKFNQYRLTRMLESLSVRQRDFVKLLPLLFHVNHPLLPGYVSKDIPVGIADFAPSRESIKLAKKITMAFDYEHRLLRFFPIKGLFLMGSPGTIAYSKNSDLDMWLCHDPAVAAEEVALLALKAQKIERYAATLDLEVHFFILSAESFSSGETLSLSDESSGSSQHALLLDEFYRSALHLAGLRPFWWCVPTEHEHRYDDYVAELTAEDSSFERDHLDFGGLTGIPATEFFGAGVWQLYKSIDSPFKSVLKLLIIESYVVEYPKIDLLSYRYKSLVSEPDTKLNDVDPYVLMYRKVDEYLLSTADSDRRSLLQKCFYIKINLALSKKNRKSDDWRVSVLKEFVGSWGWTARHLNYLDERPHWRISNAAEERKSIVAALNKSYAQLSAFARSRGEDQKISRYDLNTLGRKLYAAFERKPAKVDIITRGICKSPMEENLSIIWRQSEDAHGIWNLYAERVGADAKAETKPIKFSDSLSRLLAWCHFNHLFDAKTNWQIFAPEKKLQLSDLKRVLTKIEQYFPGGRIDSIDSQELNKNVVPRKVLLIVNFGQVPLQGRLNQNILTSNNNDAFKFGGQKINLVRSAAIIYMTSWEEVYVKNFKGPLAVQESLLELIQQSMQNHQTKKIPLDVFAACRDYTLAIQSTVEQHGEELLQFLWANRNADPVRYVTQIENGFCSLQVRQGNAKLTHHATHHTLLKALGEANESFPKIRFDSRADDCSLLSVLYENSLPSHISFFIHQHDEKADIYVIDEKGSLFVQRRESYQLEFTIGQFGQFFNNVLARKTLARSDSRTQESDSCLKTHLLSKSRSGKFSLSPHATHDVVFEQQIPVKVFVDSNSNDQQILNILVDDTDFSAAKLGNELFIEIARSILARRKNQSSYPIYINDLEFSARYQSVHDIDALQTVHLLNFKKRIEYQLSRTLEAALL